MKTRELKLGRQHRAATFVREEANEQDRTVPLSFSSEAPVERWFGIEILGHSAGEVDLDWLNGGTAPLLSDHNSRAQIGIVTEASIGTDRRGRAVVRFGKSARADEEFRDVLDGIRTNVSVGYEILDLVLEKQGKDQPDTYRATRWRPLEISLVSIPADLTVGVGRDAPDARAVTVTIPDDQPTERTSSMDPNNAPAAPTAPAAPPINLDQIRAEAAKAESERVRGIIYLGQRHQLREMADKAIAGGVSLADFRGLVLDELDKRGSTQPLDVSPAQLDLTRNETQRYSILRAIRAAHEKNPDLAPFEMECHRAIETKVGQAKRGGFYVPLDVQKREFQKRDLTVATATAGGNLVATELAAGSFIDLLRARSRVIELGAVSLNGLVGNVNIPKQTGAGTVYWLSTEATTITESQQTIGQLSLTPKNVGAYTEISRLLTLQSTPDAEAMVQMDLARVMALGIDSAAISGSGSSGQPTGIISTAGIGSVTGTTIAYAGIVEFQTDVASGNALMDNSAYLTTPAVAGLLMQRQRFSGTDTPLWSGSVLDGLVAGFRATTSTQVPSANMLFGDFSQVIIAGWGVLEIETNPYAQFTAGIIGVRAWATVDIGVRQASAFSLATGIT